MDKFILAASAAALALSVGAAQAKPVHHHKAMSQTAADAQTANLNRQQLASAVNTAPGMDNAQPGSTVMPATGSDAGSMAPPANTPDRTPSNTGAVGTSSQTNGDQSPAAGEPMGGTSTQSSQPDNTNAATPSGK